jgi:hypothetical protein
LVKASHEKLPARQTRQQKGGIVRSEKLSPAKRSEIAARAAQARWGRGPTGVDLSMIEDLQMNPDAIDAADMLVMELSEQMALLSQSGSSALASGHISEAKLIIGAIEKTQDFRSRAEQLKTDIAMFYSDFTPGNRQEFGSVDSSAAGNFEENGRTQDRTDPVLMNAKRNQILRKLETKHGIRLNRRSAAIYQSDSNQLGIVCTMSKWHAKNENYWYAYHPHQDEFLATTQRGYFVLGMMDAELAVAVPVEVIRQNLGKLNTTTTPDGRRYWHIHISRAGNGSLSLQRARGEPPLPLDRYVLHIPA